MSNSRHGFGKLKLKSNDESRYGRIVHSGFLSKKSKGKIWQQRFVVLWEDMALRFYEDESRSEGVIGKIKLKNVDEVRRLSPAQAKELNPSNPYFFSVFSNSLKKTWQFGCEDTPSLSKWVHILQSALTINSTKSGGVSSAHGDGVFNNTETEDFSVAHSMSSRASTVQSLSVDDSDAWTRPRRNRSVLSEKIDENHDYDVQDDVADDDDDGESPTLQSQQQAPQSSLPNADLDGDDDDAKDAEHGNTGVVNVEETLNRENRHIVFEGTLERKTNQKVLGKHLWETRYFKLSTHTLSIYTSDKTDIAESTIKLSSIIAINRSMKVDGSDLKDNRFDITTRDQTLNLRTESPVECQQWIHFLTLERKNHRKSIRTTLQSLESANMIKRRSNAVAPTQPPQQSRNSHQKSVTVDSKSIQRFKRNRTARFDDEDDEEDVDEDGDGDEHEEEEEEEDAGHAHAGDDTDIAGTNQKKDDAGTGTNGDNDDDDDGKLSLTAWAQNAKSSMGAKVDSTDSTDTAFNEQTNLKRGFDEHHNSNVAHLSPAASFQGFLIRHIGHGGNRNNSNKIGERIYFRLSDDTLEFSRVDETMSHEEDDDDHHQHLNALHSANILGTVSVEHIKAVRMLSDGGDDDFIIVFNESDSKTDWVLRTDKNQHGVAAEWVKILQRAQRDAKNVANTINKIGSDDDEDEDEGDSSDSEMTLSRTNRKKKGKKKKMVGSSIKALQQMINDETIEELEMARDHELKSLDNPLDLNGGNAHRNNSSTKCGCLCW
eukprot:CAMPEP_0202691622 /NCGR_PEP_ID=MMETSP1385-20130828/6286_1 /ASSEMBLY_ACC=CAM_ASM_000861 /TAXON_ID=933848 /ORGANISM="Elphidium margaritaceum" /LENGTH=769 /DNA_ID=CAMNT_0049347055 /DNA_START=32 /DNA_END=2338 /DNA_ORIENTATION=-